MSRSDAITADLAEPATGIVWAYRFAADGEAKHVPNDEVSAAVSDPSAGWLWVHLALADMRCRNWIAHHAPVSDLAREVLTGPDTHLRLESLGAELVGVVPDLHQEFAQPGDDLVRLRFVMTDRLVITARQRPVHSVENVRRAVDAGRRMSRPASLLDAVIDQFADTIALMAEQLGDELDRFEDHVMNDEPADDRHRIGRVRLRAVRVHRQLAQMRAMFHRLEPRLAYDHAEVAVVINTLGQKLDAIDAEVASLHDRARMLLDEVAAKMTEVTNKRLYTLSILTACLLPPTLVTGFFGMNTKDLPFQQSDGGTWLALLVAFASAAVCIWALRRVRAF